jgi:hypothetical protein
MPRLDETGMNRAWIRYPRKKTEWEGKTYLLKVQGEKSRWQVQADQLKPAFDLPPLGVIEVFDDETNTPGCLIPWFENEGHLAQVPWQIWATHENLKMLVRIGVFDGIIGNSDRVVSNVLVRPDGSLLPIDEGEQERFVLTPFEGWILKSDSSVPRRALWVKYRKELLKLISTTLLPPTWLEEWLSTLPSRVDGLHDFVQGTQIVRPYYREQLRRLDLVAKETVRQICV